MDRKKAKLILGSFRPDGADANSPDFAKALKLAAEDRELGAWLAHERAQDAFFAECLNEVEIPVSLREELLSVLAEEIATVSEHDVVESQVAAALSSVVVPPQLRDQVLAAMTIEQEIENKTNPESRAIWPMLTGLAALIAVAVLVLFNQSEPGNGAQNVAQLESEQKPLATLIPAEAVAQVAVSRMTRQLVHQVAGIDESQLNHESDDSEEVIHRLEQEHRPAPRSLPEGLKCAKFIGHKEMVLESGESVSLLGFECPKLGTVYLAVMDIHNLSDPEVLSTVESVSMKNCYGCDVTHYNFTHWKDGSNAYLILTKAEKEQMMGLF